MKLTYDDILHAIKRGNLLTDASTSVYFARELEFVIRRTFDIKYAALSAFALFPLSRAIPEWATSVTWYEFDQVGMAKLVENYATDFPRVDILARSHTSTIKSIGDSYGYSRQDIIESQAAGRSLSARKATAATQAQLQLINMFAFHGVPAMNLPGWFSNTNFAEIILPDDGDGGSRRLIDKTADKVIRDVSNLIQAVRVQSKGVHTATEVWLPDTAYNHMAVTQNSTASDVTILQYLQNIHKTVSFRSVLELTGSDPNGSDRMYATQNSDDNYALEIPALIQHLMPQQQMLDYVVPVHSRFAGLLCERPMSTVYAKDV